MSRRANKVRVLIADDHELVRHGTRAILSAHRGWQVIAEAVDGREAVQKTEELKPDLVVLDISMPNMDGLEATRQILMRTPKPRVLILTMHESFQMVRRVLESGAQGYVLKSDLAANLVKAVEEVMRGKLSLTARASDIVFGEAVLSKDEIGVEEPDLKPTRREFQVIRLLAQGKSNKESAAALNISTRTVEVYRARIMKKLQLKSAAEIVRYAVRHKIVEA